MKMDIRRTSLAVAPMLLFAAVAGAQTTINFGAALPEGPVPAGYAGFNWGSATNDNDGVDPLYLTGPAATMNGFSRGALFDLNSVDFQTLYSLDGGDGEIGDYTTVISGYRGSTLVKSVSAYYGTGGDFTGLNIDGVNKITFATTELQGYLNSMGGTVVVSNGPESTYVDQVVVSKYVRTASAPEMDPVTAAGALTFLLGALAVLRGRRAPGA
jgi:hypothetical protein